MASGPAANPVSDWQTVDPGDWQEVGVAAAPTVANKPPAAKNPLVNALSNFGQEAWGLIKGIPETGRAIEDPQSAIQGLSDQMAKVHERAANYWDQGDYSTALAHTILGYVPMIGPHYSDMLEQARQGDLSGAVGKYSAFAGSLAAPELLRHLPEIPTTAKAGAKFDAVMNAAKDAPVDVSKVEEIASEMNKLSSHGAPPPPKAVADFWKQGVNPEEPWTYETGRDFASNAGRPSVAERLAANPRQQALLTKYARAWDEANEAAAESRGMGDEYRAAMKQYRQAKQLEDLTAMGKKGAKYIILGGAGAAAVSKIADIMRNAKQD